LTLAPGPREKQVRLRIRFAVLTLSLSLAVFGALALGIHEQHPPSWDGYLLHFLARHGRSQPLRALFDLSLDVVGEYRGLVPVGLLLLCFIVGRRMRWASLTILVLGASVGTVVALKPAFHRPPLIAGREGYFPSTHATGAFAVGAVLALVAWRTPWRWAILGTSIAFVGLYGAALVYSRAHYPSDVIGGWCIALFWLSVGALALAKSGPR
jgi:undecaprenyl-diphosphatase